MRTFLDISWLLRSTFADGPMKKPILKQLADLAPEDFDVHAIWIHCHVVDYDQPWYDETDEETVRPWALPTPVDPSRSMLLVKAKAVFADGTECQGFLTPSKDPNPEL